MQKYIFREYDSDSPFLFEEEKRKLSKHLPINTRVEHIGSTSIPGLGGKGILDILIGISKEKFSQIKNNLLAFNYEFREGASTNNRLFFRKDYKMGNIVHIFYFVPHLFKQLNKI